MCVCVRASMYIYFTWLSHSKVPGLYTNECQIMGKMSGHGRENEAKEEEAHTFWAGEPAEGGYWISQEKPGRQLATGKNSGLSSLRVCSHTMCPHQLPPRRSSGAWSPTPAGLLLWSITSWLITCLQDRRMDLRKQQHACCLLGGTQWRPHQDTSFSSLNLWEWRAGTKGWPS